MAAGVSTAGVNNDGETALEIVVRENDVACIAFLASAPHIIAEQGATGLRRAASFGLAEVAGILLDAGVGVNEADSNGWSPLTYAAYLGNVETVRLLVSRGASHDQRDSSGMTPVIHAASRGATDIVLCLLRSGANPEARDSQGWTALHWATENGFQETVEALIGWRKDSNPN